MVLNIETINRNQWEKIRIKSAVAPFVSDRSLYESIPEKSYSYYAFLLYTNEDEKIAKYVREYFDYLNRLSREDCIVYLLDPELPNYEAYNIADDIGIGRDNLPCLVFFKNLGENKVIIYRLKNSHDNFKKGFREIFTTVAYITNLLGSTASTEDLWNALYIHYNIKRTKKFIYKVLTNPLMPVFGERVLSNDNDRIE